MKTGSFISITSPGKIPHGHHKKASPSGNRPGMLGIASIIFID